MKYIDINMSMRRVVSKMKLDDSNKALVTFVVDLTMGWGAVKLEYR